MSEFILGDCMDYLPDYPDNHFDLAIVDPPYGIGYDVEAAKRNGKKYGGKTAAKRGVYNMTNWDSSIPDSNYFKQLFRISKNQIIWGWNYFVPHLSACKCYIVWNKRTNGNFGDCESAFTSFDRPPVVFEFTWNGMIQGDMKNKEIRIHPTQKPVKLYERTLIDFAKEGDKILDTHVGSASSLIAFEKHGFEYTGFEINENIYSDAKNRMIKGIQKAMF